MKVPKIAEEEAPVDPRIPMKEQLKTDEGDLENLLDNENLVFSQWIKNFTNVAVFRFPDLFLITWWEKIPYTTAKAQKARLAMFLAIVEFSL